MGLFIPHWSTSPIRSPLRFRLALLLMPAAVLPRRLTHPLLFFCPPSRRRIPHSVASCECVLTCTFDEPIPLHTHFVHNEPRWCPLTTRRSLICCDLRDLSPTERTSTHIPSCEPADVKKLPSASLALHIGTGGGHHRRIPASLCCHDGEWRPTLRKRGMFESDFWSGVMNLMFVY
jgi:hypothetical protein